MPALAHTRARADQLHANPPRVLTPPLAPASVAGCGMWVEGPSSAGDPRQTLQATLVSAPSSPSRGTHPAEPTPEQPRQRPGGAGRPGTPSAPRALSPPSRKRPLRVPRKAGPETRVGTWHTAGLGKLQEAPSLRRGPPVATKTRETDPRRGVLRGHRSPGAQPGHGGGSARGTAGEEHCPR